MNRLGLLTLLYSLERLCDKEDFEGVTVVIKKLVAEAESEENP